MFPGGSDLINISRISDISQFWGNLLRLVQCVVRGHLTFRIQNFYDETWSSFGLLKATKLVIVWSLFYNFSMNTKPGNTASRYNPIYITSFMYIVHCTTSSIYNCNFDNSLLFTSKVSAYAARYDTKTILNNQTIFAFSYRS